MAKLTDVCDIQYGFPFNSSLFSDSEGIPVIRIRDVKRGYSETYTTESYKEEYIVYKGDFLIGMDGEFNIAKWGEIPALLNQRVCRLFPSSKIDRNYLFYFMQKKLKEIEDRTPFATVKHLSAKEINKIEFPEQDLKTQQSRGTLLAKIDYLTLLRRQQLAKLDELVKARFVEMFGDPVINPYKYDVHTLQELINSKAILYHLDGNHGSDYPRNDEFTENGVPYIGANCIVAGNIDFSLAKHLPPERAAKLRKGIAVDGDVLFAHNATVGPVVVLHTTEKKVILSTSLTAYRCNQKILLPEYLKAYMQSNGFVRQYSSEMKQTTRNQVPITAQKKYLFIIPPMELQTQFATFVQSTDQVKSTVQSSLDKLETLKQSLMQTYFG